MSKRSAFRSIMIDNIDIKENYKLIERRKLKNEN
jgi:hypothetical protein